MSSSPSAVPRKKTLPVMPLAVGGLAILVLAAAGVYLSRPVTKAADAGATQEAKAYIKNLALSDVNMQASENFANQQVVEILGSITNNGPRELKSIDVYCVFYGVNGREIHRERLRIVGGAATPGGLKPAATRAFRMPFDTLPDGWNQALPVMAIAQIDFAN